MKPLRRTLASLRIGVGKTVEVRGLVFAVPISPLGTPFINFRREYPNQTFTGSSLASKTAWRWWPDLSTSAAAKLRVRRIARVAAGSYLV